MFLEASNVSRLGKQTPRQIQIFDDAFIPGLAEVTRRVHAQGARVS